MRQSEQLATHLLDLEPQPDKLYSSPYYRCLQTLHPYITSLRARQKSDDVKVTIEPGVGEFYGTAPFTHPSPAGIEELNKHFDFLRSEAEPIIAANVKGESIAQLHDRVAYCLSELIARADSDPNGPKAILICTHAAAIIAMGRVLTGVMPEDVGEEDFKCFTCGVSKFRRRKDARQSVPASESKWDPQRPDDIPDLQWADGRGLAGGWECEANSDCSFLENGEERGWYVFIPVVFLYVYSTFPNCIVVDTISCLRVHLPVFNTRNFWMEKRRIEGLQAVSEAEDTGIASTAFL